MKKPEFLYLLLGASFVSYRFAKSFVKDKLKSDFRYDIILNYSNDDTAMEQFDFYPEDNDKRFFNLNENEVVDILCRKNKVPVWIDISVCKVDRKFTTFNLLCAGRYSDNPDEYYYKKNGSGPFGIKSPNFPPGHNKDKKFKLKNSNQLKF
ncbi:hypothetical protein [Nonlabens sp. Asnod2-A12]|uniref:hypothetical protein n=1 Tax=Nonlabens sp. Asnod2-A12 TaxID=3160578 RepID=UPI003863D192